MALGFAGDRGLLLVSYGSPDADERHLEYRTTKSSPSSSPRFSSFQFRPGMEAERDPASQALLVKTQYDCM